MQIEDLQDTFKFHSLITEDHYKEILLEGFLTFDGLLATWLSIVPYCVKRAIYGLPTVGSPS